ncbi:4-(cytidine 5'-diphospho)-2-C-methyl-D-erythritol kinase [Parasedimentitalea psychrophila]|uniref:4-diphosphocytidyl-2-C-methyl-D-erythritol kinase n=1 Tax=Parasedimentitalea psychrophila TaxID=2997337 RepID=A0A9Y2L2B4_9RHOB|nr:4-(cytidine 5'-diphospho)-2-C-methyl-D-erythritol kinase [Parasedimentitalea psychrophila]WIY26262.1 4-(cytidine 5'-diphospho)-2-C-methyl-D-erythritol kinase [Parasedimentitalea psychrophila]
MTAEAFAPAKINLTLHVTGQRPDGYHLLDSLVVFADVGDRLWLTPGDQLSIDVSGEFAEGVPTDHRNLVWQAATGAGWSGRIQLDKALPHGAGIGGGSSDAASVLKTLAIQGLPTAKEFHLSLGADVPVCMAAQASRMQGIGDQISRVALPKLPALLVNPGVPVPTGAVFSALAWRDNPPMPSNIPEFSSAQDCAAWLSEQRNDMHVPAAAIAPQIDQVLSEMKCTGNMLLARMSGSGATCFALYPTMIAAHRAAYDIGAANSDWWCVATELS